MDLYSLPWRMLILSAAVLPNLFGGNDQPRDADLHAHAPLSIGATQQDTALP